MSTEQAAPETRKEQAAREAHEADLMRRFSGVEFWWSNGERRAKLKGSGIEVWEMVRAKRDTPGCAFADMAAWWPHVDEETIASAWEYYLAEPNAIDKRIAQDDWWTEERMVAFNEEMTKYRA